MRWAGVFPVLVTPFDDDLELDLDSLRRQTAWCIERGARGLVAPVLMGEFYALSDRERLRVIETITDAAAGAVPVVAGVSGTSTQHAVELARSAEQVGATALIAMPPYTTSVGPDGVFAYFAAIARAVPLPLCIQNAQAPIGSPVSTEWLVRIARELPTIEAIKEETLPNHQRIGALVEQSANELHGVFGGLGGAYFIEELRRGASGTMPAPEFMELHVAIYDRFAAGDEAGARELFSILLYGINWERLLTVAYAKEVLVQRGVIRTARMRVPGPVLDAADREELAHTLARLAPHLRA